MARSLRALLACTWVCLTAVAVGQTLVLNEVSNGPAGTQEYFEFVVVPSGPVDPCTPVCMDLRGWIFDDNNGYHGSDGIAGGALRFSANAALWSCVPVGTLIVVYNGSDPNPALPANDISLTDGNCSIVTPLTSALFETTSATPQAVLCSNPGGWVPAGSWTCIGLRNPGDCARVADPSGCEVFTLGYGDNSLNNTIYFSGNGQRTVYFHNGGDPLLQGNWIEGCAAPAQCGSEDQTPGAPNNPANAAWLTQIDPNCGNPNPPAPLVVTATHTDACACGGTATASATGSVPGYSFVWYDDAWATIGQNTANASNLCVGTYHVIGTSSVGCVDTATVTVSSAGGPLLMSYGVQAAACGSSTGRACVAVNGGNGTTTFLWDDPLAQTTPCATGLPPGDHTVTATDAAGCSSTATVTVPDSIPNVSITVTTGRAACGSATGRACATIVNGGTATWSFGWNDPAAQTAACATALAPASYTVTATDANGCSASATAIVADSIPALSITFTTQPTACGSATGQACATVVNGGTATWDFLWNDPAAQTAACATGLLPGGHAVTVTDANGCTTSATVVVGDDVPAITVDAVENVTCAGLDDGHIALTLPDGTHTFSWTGPDGFTASTAEIDGLTPGAYTYVWAAGTPCALTATITITAPAPIDLSTTTTDALCHLQCSGIIDLSITHGVAPFSYALDELAQPTEPFVDVCPGPHAVLVTDAQGCTADATAVVGDGPFGPNAGLAPLDPLCVEAPAVAIDAVDPGGVWSGPGIADASTGRFDPALAGPGDHWVVHRIPGICGDADSIRVYVAPMPVADFLSDPGSPSVLDSRVLLINTSSNASRFRWTLDGTLLDTTLNAQFHVIPSRTDQVICLVASDLPHCADTTCRLITLTPELQVFVPNSFTPEGDAMNDVFAPIFSTPPADCTFIVFDRWGSELFHAKNYGDAHWDGGDAKTDVYVWRLIYRDPNTLDEHRRTGHVTLLR